MPFITVAPSSQSVVSPAVVQFHCQVFGQPPLSVSWEFNEALINTSLLKYSISDSLEILTVNVLSHHDDAGVYSCIVTNEMGSDSAAAHLNIQGEFTECNI